MLSIPNTILQTVPKGHSTPYSIYAAASTANYNLLYRLSGYMQGALRQTYQSNPSYCDYQKTDKKGIYQLDKDQVENQLKSFYNTFNKDDKDVTYANKGFKDVVVNFIRIKALCNKCRATFSSKQNFTITWKVVVKKWLLLLFLLNKLLLSVSSSSRLYTSHLALDLHSGARHMAPQLSP